LRDRLRQPIPNDLAGPFGAVAQFKKTKSCLARTCEMMQSILAGPSGSRLLTGAWPGLIQELEEIRVRLDELEPFTLCPTCQGQGCPPDANDGKPLCHGCGFITEAQFRSLPAQAQKSLRKRAAAA
jgi:hypothetical protein